MYVAGYDNCHITYYGEIWTFYLQNECFDTKICLILLFPKIFGKEK